MSPDAWGGLADLLMAIGLALWAVRVEQVAKRVERLERNGKR